MQDTQVIVKGYKKTNGVKRDKRQWIIIVIFILCVREREPNKSHLDVLAPQLGKIRLRVFKLKLYYLFNL